ncbi:SSU ribosomal protein S16p [Brevinematales bacterium NS]|nr:30S ribosomal protein S16 [Brevinematales bacterium]QJR21213.1 SSU ribosomal protein S16p [Brevinematales bacterium NS]
MAVHIRLTRMGKAKQPYYRIVVVDSRAPRDGAYIESLGYYHPTEEGKTSLDLARYEEWIRKGAIPTDVVKNLAKKAKRA